MNLYILKRKPDWKEYDVVNGIVVRAVSAKNARALAANSHGDEGYDTWIHPSKSSCKRLKETGRAGVIIKDFNAG